MDFISLLGKPDVNTKKWTFTLFTFQRPRSKSCFYCWLAMCMCKYVQFRVPEFALLIPGLREMGRLKHSVNGRDWGSDGYDCWHYGCDSRLPQRSPSYPGGCAASLSTGCSAWSPCLPIPLPQTPILAPGIQAMLFLGPALAVNTQALVSKCRTQRKVT
jgi:hypothetical protein